MRSRLVGSAVFWPILCVWLGSGAGAGVLPEAIRGEDLEGGLAVHLGTTDGQIEIDLARGGRLLVHGLALDAKSLAAARARIEAAGVYGLVSVERAESLRTLPYAANLVNVLLADADALGDAAPTEAEMLRVVAPGGIVCLKRGGRWTRTVKPRPGEMDEWTHYDHGPDGNPVSSDTLVAPVTALRWYAAPTISRTGSEKEAGLRMTGGRIVYALKDYGVQGRLPRGTRNHLVCRDAYNGVLLWKIPIAKEKYVPYRHEFIAAGDRVYAVLAETGPMVALDARTGKTAVTYDQGVHVQPLERDERRRENRGRRHLVARLCGDRLIQAYQATLCVLDAKTGKRLWTFASGKGKSIALVVAGEGKVFAAVGSEETLAMRGTVAIKMGEIVALDTESGRRLWRNADFAGNYLLRLVYHDGHLPIAYFPGTDRKGRKDETPMTGYGHKFAVANVRAADGRTVWRQEEQQSVGGHYAITFVRDGKAYVACERYIGYDLKTGAFEKGIGQRTFVNACAETRATPNYILYGMSFGDRYGRFSPRAIARSTCDTGVFPANGLVYCSPPLCMCLDVVAGYIACAAEDEPDPVPDANRLVAGDATARPSGAAAPWPTPGDWPMFMGGPTRGCWTPSRVDPEMKPAWQVRVDDWPGGLPAQDWHDTEHTPGLVTAPTAAGGVVYVAAPHRHRLEARSADTGERLWSFTAGGRIDSPPTLYGGLCLFGCRDGWIYALGAGDGRLVWKFLAAPETKRIIDNSHVESPWPVFGSVMIHKGGLYATAGRHSAVDGGIRLYQLDPLTGRMVWRARIASAVVDDAPPGEIPVYSNHGKVGKYYPRAAHLLVSDGARLHHFIETLKDTYSPGERVELYASNGRWDRVDPAPMTWLRSNMLGFISRRCESIGRFDYGGVRYSNVNADAMVIADRALYCVNGRQPKAQRDKFGQLTCVPLGKDGRVGEESVWKAKILHREDKREHSNFRVVAMLVAGDVLLAAGHVSEKPASALHAYSARDGSKLGQWDLPARPVRNGLAAAGGKLYVSCEDGTLHGFAKP